MALIDNAAPAPTGTPIAPPLAVTPPALPADASAPKPVAVSATPPTLAASLPATAPAVDVGKPIEPVSPLAPKTDAPKSEPDKKSDPMAQVLARIEAQDALIASLKTELESTRAAAQSAVGDVRGRMIDELMTSADIQPRYHKLVRAELGDLDPKSDAAKARLDEFTRAFPEALTPRPAARASNSEWVSRIEAQQKNPGSARGTMLGAISPASLAAIVRRNG